MFIFLKGNHEDMLDKFINGADRFTYLLNGGQQTLDSYLTKPVQSEFFPIPPDHMEFFKSLRLFYETEEFIFVHAGLRPGCLWNPRTLKTCCGFEINLSPPNMISANA